MAVKHSIKFCGEESLETAQLRAIEKVLKKMAKNHALEKEWGSDLLFAGEMVTDSLVRQWCARYGGNCRTILFKYLMFNFERLELLEEPWVKEVKYYFPGDRLVSRNICSPLGIKS